MDPSEIPGPSPPSSIYGWTSPTTVLLGVVHIFQERSNFWDCGSYIFEIFGPWGKIRGPRSVMTDYLKMASICHIFIRALIHS